MPKSKPKSKTKLSPEKESKIKEQVEYYLSDENLSKDSFFHDKVSSDPNGFVNLDFILKCNKIKSEGWTKSEIQKSLKNSDLLELDKTGEKIRRKNNKPLPELKFLQKKRKISEEKEKNTTNENLKKDTIILTITCEKKSESSWKTIIEEFKKLNPELDVVYARFKDTEGNIGIISESEENLKFSEKFKLDDIEYNVKKCEGNDLVEFWKNHGTHFDYCMKLKNKNETKKSKKKKNVNYLSNGVKLGDQEYKDASLIKAEVRKILNSHSDDEKLTGKEKDFVLDLLKFHHKYEEKVKDMDYIIVGKTEEYKYSRCFIIVKKNKDRVDFSAKKCIENLINKQNE